MRFTKHILLCLLAVGFVLTAGGRTSEVLSANDIAAQKTTDGAALVSVDSRATLLSDGGDTQQSATDSTAVQPTIDDTAPQTTIDDETALELGLELFHRDEFDPARKQLLVSARSRDAYIRAESFLYLNALETELGNYDTARAYLERYHAETMSLMRRATHAEQQMTERMARLDRRNNLIIGGLVLVGLALIAVWLVVQRRRSDVTSRRKATEHSTDFAEVLGSPHGGAGGAESGGGTISQSLLASDRNRIENRQPYLDEAEVFRQTPIYAEIVELSNQKADRNARVLSLVRQDDLDGELERSFAQFRKFLREEYSALTAGDIKLACLSLVPLTSFGRALCWGSTETNIIKQRKHQIKKKLSTPSGRALFEFIFSLR